MNQRVSPLLLVSAAVIVLGAAAAFWLPSSDGRRVPTGDPGKPTVVASIYPLYDIVRNIAGDAVQVDLILPPGSSPHAYEPRPSDLRKLDAAEAAYVIGYGLDSWMETLAETSTTPLVTVDQGIAIREIREVGAHEDEGAHDEEELAHGHTHEDGDPHYWLDVANAKLMAQNIANDLSARFPDHATTFAARLTTYHRELDEADREMHAALSGLTNRKIVTMHDAWYYFAEAYGLEIVGSFEPTPGREPTPQYLVELKEAIEASGTKTLYTEPLIATTSIQSFIQDNGLTVATLDPVEGAAGAEHHYVDIMLQNAQTIRSRQ